MLLLSPTLASGKTLLGGGGARSRTSVSTEGLGLGHLGIQEEKTKSFTAKGIGAPSLLPYEGLNILSLEDLYFWAIQHP